MRCVLFDVDGVLVDSWTAYRRVWSSWAAHHRLVDAAVWAATHGRRPHDTIAEVAPHLDAPTELARLDDLVAASEHGFRAYPGAAALLRTLPSDRWGVVTSGGRALTRARFLRNGLPLPRVMVCAEDVTRGKPDPQPYATAAAALGTSARDCLVVEDAPAGLAAAGAAGMSTVAVLTTHDAAELVAADQVVDRLTDAVPLVRSWLEG
jgi:mannitol-1-/sugar-/sorbitol-6-phosphatase